MCTKQNGETAVNPAPLTEQATEHFTKEEKEHLKFFFDWQTKEFLASFEQKPEEVENLDYYPIIKLRSITKLLGHLHRPWDQYIPFLYQAFAQHIASIEEILIFVDKHWNRVRKSWLSSFTSSRIELISIAWETFMPGKSAY